MCFYEFNPKYGYVLTKYYKTVLKHQFQGCF